jgi:hypothetical protein
LSSIILLNQVLADDEFHLYFFVPRVGVDIAAMSGQVLLEHYYRFAVLNLLHWYC